MSEPARATMPHSNLRSKDVLNLLKDALATQTLIHEQERSLLENDDGPQINLDASLVETQSEWLNHIRRLLIGKRVLADVLKQPKVSDETISLDARHHSDMRAILPMCQTAVSTGASKLLAVEWLAQSKMSDLGKIDDQNLQMMKLNAACSQRSQVIDLRRKEIFRRLASVD